MTRIREQLADWQAAIGWAPTLPGGDPGRLAIWGFSVSGGHVFRAAARNPQLAAAIAQTPNADGHYAAFLGAHELAVQAKVAFLRRHLLGHLGANHLLAGDA
jgi:uncharacterized protein